MKKVKINQRLLGYSCLATSFMTIGQQGDAQVVFYDYTPDAVITPDFEGPYYTSSYGSSTGLLRTGDFDLDLDLDGIADASLSFDFHFSSSDSVGGGFKKIVAKPGVNIEFAGVSSGPRFLAYGLPTGSVIDDNLNWGSSSATMRKISIGVSTTYSFGNWSGTSVGMLAFRFGNGAGDYLYGWLRFSSDPSWFSGPFGTIYDYALSFSPNQPIAAGVNPGPGDCDVPVSLNATPISSSSVQLSWTPDADNLRTQVQGKMIGAPNFRNVFSIPNARVFNGLTAGETYEWKARSFCDNGLVSAMSPLQSFTMPILKDLDQSTNEFNSEHSDLVAYGFAGNLHLHSNKEMSEVLLYDLLGRQIASLSINDVHAIVPDLAPGVYLVAVKHGDAESWKKVVI